MFDYLVRRDSGAVREVCDALTPKDRLDLVRGNRRVGLIRNPRRNDVAYAVLLEGLDQSVQSTLTACEKPDRLYDQGLMSQITLRALDNPAGFVQRVHEIFISFRKAG